MGSAADDRHLKVEQQRAAVVAEAHKWIGTPFHHEARVCGAGVDCSNLVIAAFVGPGVVEHIDQPHYTQDWMMHSDDTRYVDGILKFCDEVEGPPARTPRPGDIVVWRYGRAYAHGAIVISWPMVIHAYNREPVCPTDAETDLRLLFVGENVPEKNLVRPRRFFVLKEWLAAELAV